MKAKNPYHNKLKNDVEMEVTSFTNSHSSYKGENQVINRKRKQSVYVLLGGKKQDREDN